MHDRKKERAIAFLEIAMALMLLVGCEGQGIQNQTEQEETNIASQVQQNVEEEAILNEASRNNQKNRKSQSGRNKQRSLNRYKRSFPVFRHRKDWMRKES